MSACLEPSAVVTRALGTSDLDNVIRIEKASYPFPWTRGIFSDCLRVVNHINQRTDSPEIPWSAQNQIVETMVPAAAGVASPWK